MRPDEMFATDLEPLFRKALDEMRKRYSQYPCNKVQQLTEHDALVGLKGHLIDPPMLGRGEIKKDVGDDDMGRLAIYVLGGSNVSSFRYKAKVGAAYAGTKPRRIEFDEASARVTLMFPWPDVVATSEVREWYEKYRAWMEAYLESLRVEANEHNRLLEDTARSLIASRKAECAKRVDIVKDL